MACCGPKERPRVPASRERLGVVAGQKPRPQFKDPVFVDHVGHPVLCQLRLERRLVELDVAKRG